jgi:uroporphyrinogen III methyltransferase/synthase
MGLKGKTVLLTRARSQNASLRNGLEGFGARVVEIPTIEITGPNSWAPVDQAIERLEEYDWVVFTSANAVDAFFSRGRGELKNVAAVGSQTARRLEERGQDVDLVPVDFRSEGLLRIFPSDLKGVRILLPRAEAAGEDLPKEMRNRGATVDEVVVYRTRLPSWGRTELRQLLEEHQIDCVTFTSGSTVQNFIDMIDAVDLESLLSGTVVAVIGPVTGQAAAAAGLRVDIQAEKTTIADLVREIRDYFDQDKRN